MSKPQPLYNRLFFERPLFELVRAIGWRRLPTAEAREMMSTLVQRFGNEVMQRAAEELLAWEGPLGAEPIWFLAPAVHHLARAIIGPPPEPNGSPATSAKS